MKPSRILVIDDNLEFLKLVKSYLKRCGWKVAIASDVQQCWMEIQRNLPDVILADMLVGISDGFRLVKSIKEAEEYSQIPVIAMTGLVGVGERMRCYKVGCYDVISKPFSMEELRRRIDSLVKLVT